MIQAEWSRRVMLRMCSSPQVIDTVVVAVVVVVALQNQLSVAPWRLL
jgi:hypothetical protein